MSDVYNRLVELMTAEFGFEADEIKPEDTFNDLELDSLALVELTMAVSADLGVKIGDDDLGPDDSIERAAQIIESKIGASQGAA
ncbi:acyl carrier protein [Wenjunlia vitaminophila]|uniref:Acyl carrier protein n=1 Tax=Wenjunlia vitaminophila TaxID=76728 RepID=A0A0T6LKE8_WENVI|nr:phosphopantetheine-binding protein [Wenjunlia vitaminophila]KRV46504.1 acyl carrier protein [Wenjunlia vitaminophila]